MDRIEREIGWETERGPRRTNVPTAKNEDIGSKTDPRGLEDPEDPNLRPPS